MSFNLATILREQAKSNPDKPLIYFGDTSWTYRQVDEMSARVAAGLRGLGLRPQQKVAVQLPNLPQFVFAYFGILKAGLVMVPLNPMLRAPEVAYHLENSDSAVLITFGEIAAEAMKGAAGLDELRVFVVTTPNGPGRPEHTFAFEDLYQSGEKVDVTLFEPTNADDTAVLIYTSGTTGHPKGAELTHFQLFMACTIGGHTFDYQPDDVTLIVLPLFHVFGLSSTLNVSIRYGGSAVLLPRFDVKAILDAVETHGCTVFCGVPTMYIALLYADLAGRDLSTLRSGVSGGASIPGEVIRAFEEKFPGVVILEGYGMSETVGTATFNASAELRRTQSIGLPLWGTEIRVVDDQDKDLPPGAAHVGEILVRGCTVMKGYYHNPEASAKALRGGWLHTEDLAYYDADGFIFIVDRKTDLIIRGGYNVYPREIEEVLHAHPAIQEASVIGRPDARLGEEVVAFVSLRAGITATAEELIAYTKDRLAAYKYPRRIITLDKLPKGSSGKILKTALREL
jgi:long-chain acyl-CoA synthetase